MSGALLAVCSTALLLSPPLSTRQVTFGSRRQLLQYGTRHTNFGSRRRLMQYGTAALLVATTVPAGGASAYDFIAFAEQQQQDARAVQMERAAAAAKAAAETRPAPLVTSEPGQIAAPTAAPTDEFSIEFSPDKPIGLTLRDLRVGFETGIKEGTSRVLVADVTPNGQAASGGRIEIDNIIVAINGVNVEKEDAKQVTARIAAARRELQPLTITFKDALAFNSRLTDTRDSEPVATVIAPGSEASDAQVLSVRRLETPDRCRRTAQTGDLLEIRYAGRLADGIVFDGMELGQRLGDDSLQFVLGKQPAGQFPPAWDVGLVGMCVGERREIDVPPLLGFGPKGLPKRGVPPNARLLYDVELLAINADSSI